MDGSLWERVDGSLWREVKIPTNHEFLQKYHQWIYRKVSDRFRRDKDRVQDTVQNVRVRLLQKDFIGRWFFKHLTHELVDRTQAEFVLGNNIKLKFISAVSPVVGTRGQIDSLWRVSDLLEYAKFNRERYFYSVQGHTINSDTTLKLLGYPPGSYNALKSLYKQGRLKPSELTGHECSESLLTALPVNGLCSEPGCGKKHFSRGFCTKHYGRRLKDRCPICDRGRASLRSKGLSLADDWMKSSHAAALRWDDSQLKSFLRRWRGQNMISSVPQRIVRPDGQTGPYKGIEAGLLKYAWNLINNEVINDFKRMTRTMDMTCMVFNDGVSPDADGSDAVVWELDDDGMKTQMVVKDSSSMDEFFASENGFDIMSMVRRANLSDNEIDVIMQVDLLEENVRKYADAIGESTARVHRTRSSALEKMRHVDVSDAVLIDMVENVCQKHECNSDDMFGNSRVGPCVLARTEFFYKLSKLGLSVEEMSARTGVSVDRVSSSVGRGELRQKACEGALVQ